MVAALVATLPAAASITAAAPPAAAQGRPSVAVVLTQITPQVPKRADTLQISGYVSNTGEAEVGPLTVHLERAISPFTERSTFDAFADGTQDHSTIAVDGSQVELNGTIGPGDLDPFRLRVRLASLHLGQRGSYAVKVVTEGRDVRAETRTFLPWVPNPRDVTPTRVVLLWPLVDRPVRGQDGVFTDDHLTSQLGAKGRLSGLVAAGAGAPVSWVVDPDLIESVEAMSNGYRVRSADGVAAGSGSQAAKSWLDLLRAGAAGKPALALPYADADVGALATAKRRSDIDAAASVTAETMERVLPDHKVTPLAWPSSGFANDATITALRQAGYGLTVLSADAIPPASELTFTPTGVATVSSRDGALQGLLADRVLSDILAEDTRRPGVGTLMVQRLVAETAMITEERPNRQRTVLIAPPKRWSPQSDVARQLVAAYTSTPWIKPTSVDELATTAGDVERQRPAYPKDAQRAEISQRYVAAVARLAKGVAAFGGVLTDSTELMSSYRSALLRAESSAWANGRGRVAAAGSRYLAGLRRGFDSQRDKVRILSRGTVTLSSKSGTIPVTIANDLEQPVTVQLALRARVSSRLHVDNPPPFRVDAKSRETVEVKASAVANGIVIVDAVLTNPRGERVGPISQFNVRATDFGRVGFFIIGGAIALLFISIIFRLGRRHMRRAPPGDTAVPDQPTTPRVGV
jgi:hypothetical protein